MSSIKRYELDEILPSLEVAQKICEVLNVGLGDLCGENKGDILKIQGLTEDQKKAVSDLVDMFCWENASRKPYEHREKIVCKLTQQIFSI